MFRSSLQVSLRNRHSSAQLNPLLNFSLDDFRQKSLRFTPPIVSTRGISDASATVDHARLREIRDIPSRLLTAALPFVPTHGFTSSTIIAGAASQPELQDLAISPRTLFGLFPSTTTASTSNSDTPNGREPIGPSKALAQCWIEEGNRRMKSTVKSEGLTLEKDGIAGVKRAFEIRLAYNRTISNQLLLKAFALITTPTDPFWGLRLPVEPPHIIPYGSHAFNVAAAALAGLQDYSRSREWMLRRIRLAGVYSAAELRSIGDDQLYSPDASELERLLEGSESIAAHVGNTIEFITYLNRSRQAIQKSLWLL